LRFQADSGDALRARQRPGIAAIAIVIAVIAIIVVASAAAYYVLVANVSTSSTTSHSSTISSTTIPSSSSTSTTSHSSITTSSTSSTAVASGVKTYNATFGFILPAGPSGERTFSNNDTVQTYGSIQNGSGSFTFDINPANYSGSGSGHGTLTVTTTGFCSGKVSFPYTFTIPDATTILGGNITVFVGNPTPANFTVPLTCTGPTTGISATGDTDPFLSTYPNEISVVAAPVTISENLTGGISYHFTITPTN
jgi:hypothetical protein